MFPEEDKRSVVSMEAYSELHEADHKGRWLLFSLFDYRFHIMGIVVVVIKKKKNKARSKI